MNRITFVVPTKEHEAKAREYIEEHNKNGEYVMFGGALIGKKPYDDWLRQLKNNSDEKTVDPKWVVSSTLFAMNGEKIIGMIDIRHTLNQYLQAYGGHIGYGVRPTERNKGYAAEILNLGLVFCRNLGLKKVMLVCHKDNHGSSKTIEKCGGTLEREFLYTDGEPFQVYWISI